MKPRLQEVLEELIQQTVETFELLRRRLSWAIAQIPAALNWVADQIRASWDRLCDLMEQVWDVLRPVLQLPGWPWSLWSTADAWTQDVGGPVSAQAATAQAGSLDTDNHWSGEAADRYREILPQQHAAIAAIKTQFADTVKSGMVKMWVGIVVFWGATVAALAILIKALMAAAAAAASVVGAPAAPAAAGTGVVAFLAAMAVGMATLFGTALTAKSEFVGAANDFIAFGGRRWPRAELM